MANKKTSRMGLLILTLSLFSLTSLVYHSKIFLQEMHILFNIPLSRSRQRYVFLKLVNTYCLDGRHNTMYLRDSITPIQSGFQNDAMRRRGFATKNLSLMFENLAVLALLRA